MEKKLLFATVFVLLTALKVNAGFTDIVEDTNIYNGSYNVIRVFGSANLNFYGDSVDLLDFHDTSTGSFYGGTVKEIDVAASAVIQLWGGQIDGMYSHNIVHIFGQNIEIEPYNIDDLYVHGFWGNGMPFDFIAWRGVSYNSQFVIQRAPSTSVISSAVRP
jgi:hypothetical protein